MPYIPESEKPRVLKHGAFEAGELNYEITMAINRFLKKRPVSYCYLNDVMGALEGAKLEFYRRVVVPYENQKLSENGDVYDTAPQKDDKLNK